MSVIKSGASPTELTIDAISNAARVSLYDVNGNILTGTEDSSITINLSALSATVELETSGHNGVGFTITNMGNVGNIITCEFTVDNTWIGVPAINLSTNNSTQTVTTAGSYTMRFGEGVSKVRLRMSTYVAGTATGTLNASYANANNIVIRSYANVLSVVNSTTAQLAGGATFTGVWEADIYWQGCITEWFADQDLTIKFQQSSDGITVHTEDIFYYKAGSTDNSTAINLISNYHRIVITNTSAVLTTTLFANVYSCPNFTTEPRSLTHAGNKRVEIPEKATYRACFSGTPVATATFTIKGSATKTVKITKFGFSQSGTGSTFIDVLVKKYSSIVTGGGASATITGVPMNSRSAAATAVVQNWTITPGTQTAVGTINAVRYRSSVAADNIEVTMHEYVFGDSQRGASALTLIGIAEWAGIDLSALAANANASIYVEWTEE